jgi:hypothetical protein
MSLGTGERQVNLEDITRLQRVVLRKGDRKKMSLGVEEKILIELL